MQKIILVVFVLMYQCNANINPYGPTVVSDCTNCINEIIQNEFLKPGLVIFANTNNVSTSVLRIRTELIRNINKEIKFTVEVMSPYKEVEVCQEDINKMNVLHVDHYEALPIADYFILIIESYQDFSYLASKIIRSRNWNPFAKFIVLMLNFLNSDQSNIKGIEIILTCLFKYNAVNVVVALPQANNYRTSIVYSWRPFDPPKYCGDVNESAKDRLFVINKCEKGVLKYDNPVFENKIPRNMSGCILKILVLPHQPYISEDENDANIEKVLANRILNRFNFIPNYTLINDFRGERVNDGEWNGGLKKLTLRNGHILLGGIFPDFDVHEDFECSLTYLAATYTWVVPRAPRSPRWISLLVIFKDSVWYCAVTGFIICAVSWRIIGQLCEDSPYNRLIEHCFINTWICIIGFVTYKRPIKNSLQAFFVFLNLYSMLFLTAYQTKLFDMLTNPSYEYQIQTVEELVASGLKFGGSEELSDLFVNSTDPLDYYIGTEWIKIHNITDAILDVAVHRNFSLLCSRLELAHISAVLPELSDSHGNYKYYAFQGNMFSVPIEMVALKGFPFMQEFSNTITLFKQSGLNEALIKQYAEFNERRRARLLRSIIHEKHDVNPLSMEHLQGGFLMLALGYFGGSISFIIEIIISSNYIKGKLYGKIKYFRR